MPTTYVSPKKPNPQNRNRAHQKVALIGDSITELSGYPNRATKILGPNYTIGNFGACGTTVSLDSYSPYLRTEAFVEAKNFQPDIAVIMLGTNDADSNSHFSRSHFIADYITLIEQLQTLSSKPRVYLVKPPPLFNDWAGLSGEVLIKEIIPALVLIAKKANLPVIDVYSVLSKPSYFFEGVHPNDLGAKVMAKVICQAITLN